MFSNSSLRNRKIADMIAYPVFCDPRFSVLLADFDLDDVSGEEAKNCTTYGLWPDLRLAYANTAWSQFAAENGGEPAISTDWHLGRCVLDAIAEPLRPFFAKNYRRCLRESRPWEHTYECSSADLYRRFHMSVFPLRRAEGLLVVNSLRIESAHDRNSLPPLENRYRNGGGIITQCCHCRRVQRADNETIWDWVSEWVERFPQRTSHGICPACCGFYYSESRFDAADHTEPFSTTCSP